MLLTMDSKDILKMRKDLGLTQEKFAQRLGVSWATINRWENGHFKPSQLAIEKIIKIQAEEIRRKGQPVSV